MGLIGRDSPLVYKVVEAPSTRVPRHPYDRRAGMWRVRGREVLRVPVIHRAL